MIHPSAIVEKGAELGSRVEVGPFAYVGPHVKLGDDCEVRARATVLGRTAAGDGNVFFTNCVIGDAPQDLKYKGEDTRTLIGENNHFREGSTVHAGTAVGGGVTRIGDHNRFFVCVHIAHDSVIGNHVIIANNSLLAGHVHVEDCVTMGGQMGIHHFVTVGRYAMLGGFTRVTIDAPPYMIMLGYEARPRSPNLPALKRWQLPEDEITALTKAYRGLYGRRANDDMAFIQRLEAVENELGQSAHVSYLCQFLRRSAEQGRNGRYLESQRRDQPADSQTFFEKKMVGETTT